MDAEEAAAATDVALERTPVNPPASSRARLRSVTARSSSVGAPAKRGARPSRRIVAIPTGIESCRKPVVFENTSTRKRTGDAREPGAPSPDEDAEPVATTVKTSIAIKTP